MASRLGVQNQITWLGQIEGKEKSDTFAAADVYVLPSQSENFGIALAEALSFGIPCITTPGVAISRAIGDANAGLVVEPEGLAIANALQQVLGDQELRKELRANAWALVKREYSLEVMGARLLELYEGIIDGGVPS